MISKEEVRKIAELARLGLKESEVDKFQKELSAILDYAEKLKEIKIEGIEPTSHSIPIKNVMREDKSEKSKSETRKKMIEQAPESQKEYLKVKSIF